MKKCSHCKVNFSSPDNRCPLCYRISEETEGSEDYAYPIIPLRYSSQKGIKLLMFISVIIAVILISLGYIIKISLRAVLFSLCIIATMWIVLISMLQKRRSIIKSFLNQILTFSALFVIWDFATDYRGWSISYAIPILNVSALIAMFVAAKITRSKPVDFLIYLLIAGFSGLLPFLFLLMKLTENPIPSVLCVGTSVIAISGIAIFYGEIILEEIKKKMSL